MTNGKAAADWRDKKRRNTMEEYKKVQRANEARFKRSQRGTVLWHGARGRVLVHKPGRHISKAEKKRVKIWSRSMAILNAAAEGKTVLRNNDFMVRVSRDSDASTIRMEGGPYA
jgi:hypothetical protein